MVTRLCIVLAAALVEALPLSLLSRLIAAWDGATGSPALETAPLTVAIVAAYVLTRLLLRSHVPERPARLALLLAALVAAPLLMFAPWPLHPARLLPAVTTGVVVIWALALFAWSRGAALAREERAGNLFGAVYAAFRRGLAVLFGVLALSAPSGGDAGRQLVEHSWGSVFLFFVTALCALALARVDEEQRRGGAQGERPVVRAEWLTTLLGAVGMVALIGLALALLISPRAVTAMLAAIGSLFAHLGDLMVWLLTPIFWALSVILDPLARFLLPFFAHPRHLHAHDNAATRARAINAALRDVESHVGHAAVVALSVAVALAVLWYAYARLLRSRDGIPDEERASLWSWSLPLAWLRRLWARLSRRRHAAPPVMPAAAAFDGASSIREAYRRFLRRGAGLGHARAAPETPQEYLGRLRRVPIADERDASLLTSVYMGVRYGDEAEQPAQAEQALRAWERLEKSLGEGD